MAAVQIHHVYVQSYLAVANDKFGRALAPILKHLQVTGQYEDSRQEAALAALECERAGMSLQDARRHCQRAAVRFMRSLGFRQGPRPNRSYIIPELPLIAA